ncbi:hypothetical protein BLNAU_20905 [Blattamonas nauphoetae]|uniref:Right handed beta helix domain-containing protein n=1 Tax=Blattamonas nauphoetae TaxID=2049346 RepID=A0ABQ9WXX0_9EUKA|nr:hypothetical protein BLNAU_20905 [Blattamonas nauphoetae]
MHMEGRNDSSKQGVNVEGKNGHEAGKGITTMFTFSNSTASLWNLIFDSGSIGTCVGRLWSSYVGIVGSRILSNAERSPFVIVGGNCGVGSTVYLIDSVHESSSCGTLLPLTCVLRMEREEKEWLERERDGWGETGEIWVSGSGMEVQNVCLIVGSGPLFGRSEDEKKDRLGRKKCEVWTRLFGSRIWNTTSRLGNGVEGMGEGIVGCTVWSSTNHLCGTAIGGMDHGGSVLSQNTSFTHCHTPSLPNADAETRHSQHFTTPTKLSVKYPRNHAFTLCTFKKCTSSSHGGAIYTGLEGANLQMEKCSFNECHADDYGGGVCLRAINPYTCTFSLSSSSFVGCSTDYWGGSVFFATCNSLYIDDCVFVDSTTFSSGGAFFCGESSDRPSSGFSNVLFQNCQQTDTEHYGSGGGAIRLDYPSSLTFSFVQFRQCVAACGRGHDIHLYNITFNSSSYLTCDSTSSNIHRVTNYNNDHSSLLANPQSEVRVESLVSKQTRDDAVDLTLELDKAVSGTMIVIVSNLDGAQPDEVGTAPKIGRMLMFSFSSSTVGTCSTTVGESGLLQLPLSDYKLLAASLSNHSVTVQSDLAFSVTPILHLAFCDLDESRTKAQLWKCRFVMTNLGGVWEEFRRE